jgi:hypothetical protein
MLDDLYCGFDTNPSYCFVNGEIFKSEMVIKIRITHPSNLIFDFSQVSSYLSSKGYDVSFFDRRNDDRSPFSPGDEWWIIKKPANSVGKPFSSLFSVLNNPPS